MHEVVKHLTRNNIELRDALRLLARHLPYLEQTGQVGSRERTIIADAIKTAEAGSPLLRLAADESLRKLDEWDDDETPTTTFVATNHGS